MQKSVLIVEDQESMALALSFLVRHEGHLAEVIDGLDAAPDAIARRHPDLVILDADLAAGSALDLCQGLSRRESGGLPRILLLSAACGRIDIERGFALGADAVLPKPFALGDLRATIRTLLEDPDPVPEGAAAGGDTERVSHA